MIRGRTIRVPLAPDVNKNVDEFERIRVDSRNIRYTDANNAIKRPGYTGKWDTANEYPIIELIPIDTGYAMDTNGTIYKLGSSVNAIYSSSTLSRRPQWIMDGDDFILVSGAAPIVISNEDIDILAIDAPLGWFIANIGTYTVISGHNDTEFRWSVPGNARNWDVGSGAGFANIEKTGKNRHMLEHRKRLYFFTDDKIETWGFTGTSAPFRRLTGQTIDIGLGAINSVIKTDDTFFWFGDDGAFYVFDGSGGRRLSDPYRKELDTMNNFKDLYGMHIRKEKLVQWTSPHDGKTYNFDYAHGKWLDDNRWQGGWQSMPFLSYMELDNKQYYGSRGHDGQIYEWSTDNKDDNGQPIRVLRTISLPLSENGNSGKVNRARFRRKGGVVTTSETSPEFMVRTRFDKGNWSDYENLTIGAQGQHDPYVDLYRLGLGRELEMEITESDATEYLLTDILLTVEGLKH
jgi:hypothetical protein